MRLRVTANRMTRTVNPNVPATLTASSGYTNVRGIQQPNYAAPVSLSLQVQALTQSELEHLDRLNITNGQASVFADRQLNTADRPSQSGGDIITFADAAGVPADLRGTTWLVVAVLEGWVGSGWCKAAITRQMG